MKKCLNCGGENIQYSAFCKPLCGYIWGLIDIQQGKWTAVAHKPRGKDYGKL